MGNYDKSKHMMERKSRNEKSGMKNKIKKCVLATRLRKIRMEKMTIKLMVKRGNRSEKRERKEHE